MYDYFVGELHCPRCGTNNGATTLTNMQTHIRGVHAEGSRLAAGFVFDADMLTPERLNEAGYMVISLPKDPQSPRLLDIWICTACKTEQWAAVEIIELRIRSVTAVTLNKSSFEASNYIDDTNAENLALVLLDLTWAEFSERKLNAVEVLRQRLE